MVSNGVYCFLGPFPALSPLSNTFKAGAFPPALEKPSDGLRFGLGLGPPKTGRLLPF